MPAWAIRSRIGAGLRVRHLVFPDLERLEVLRQETTRPFTYPSGHRGHAGQRIEALLIR